MKRNAIKSTPDNNPLRTSYTCKRDNTHTPTNNNNKIAYDKPLSPLSSFSFHQRQSSKEHKALKESIENKEGSCLLCQNCINKKLAQDKRSKRQIEERESTMNYQYNDDLIEKLRLNHETAKANQILKRENQAKEIGQNLTKFKVSTKDDLISKNEQAINFFSKENNYDCYLKARRRQNNTETVIKNNIDKYIATDKIKDDYYSKYVDKPFDQINDINSDYQLKRQKYHEDLLKQIEDNQVNRNKKYEEKQLNDRKLTFENEKKRLMEYNQSELRRKNEINKLREYNEMIIKEKNDRLNKENKMNQDAEHEYRKKLNKELSDYNQMMEEQKRKATKEYKGYLNTIEKQNELRMKKEKYKSNKSSSLSPPENHLIISKNNNDLLHQCSVCHKEYPKRFLSRNPFVKI